LTVKKYSIYKKDNRTSKIPYIFWVAFEKWDFDIFLVLSIGIIY